MQKPNAQNPHRHGDDRRWVINSLIPRALFRTRKNRKSISAIQYIHIYTIPKRISLSYDRRTIKHILWLNRMWDHRHFSTYVFIGFLCFGNTGCEREIREPKARAQGRRGCPGGALGQVSYGGVQLRGPNPYPILGKAGLRKHTLF